MSNKFLNKLSLMRNMHNFGEPVNNNAHRAAKRLARQRYGRLSKDGVIYIPKRYLYNNTGRPIMPPHIKAILNKYNNNKKRSNNDYYLYATILVLIVMVLFFFFGKTR